MKNISDVKVVSFLVESMLVTRSLDGGGSLRLGDGSQVDSKLREERSALELIVELGVVGISVVDHKPRELAYLYMERVSISYSTGYDGGTTSRFQYLQVISRHCYVILCLDSLKQSFSQYLGLLPLLIDSLCFYFHLLSFYSRQIAEHVTHLFILPVGF